MAISVTKEHYFGMLGWDQIHLLEIGYQVFDAKTITTHGQVTSYCELWRTEVHW